MKLGIFYTTLLAILLLPALPVGAADHPLIDIRNLEIVQGGARLEGGSRAGAVQRDTLVLFGGEGTVEGKFEDPWGIPSWNGWTHFDPTGVVGDFAQLLTDLSDLDECADNPSSQVCFVDDGEIVPGTGGSPCISWCYGPGGYVLNSTGGLAGPGTLLHNSIASPAIELPGGDYNKLILEFDAYLDNGTGIWWDHPFFAVGQVEVSDDPGDDGSWIVLEAFGFHARSGDPRYLRPKVEALIGDEGAGWARAVLLVVQLESSGPTDCTPGPYLDNVKLQAVGDHHPMISVEATGLAQDAFPASGHMDIAHPEQLSVRFDPARRIEETAGDVLRLQATVAHPEGLLAAPRLAYRLVRNPVFDPWRSSGLPELGSVEAWPLEVNSSGSGEWACDLPDSGFLFPGDRILYYFTVTETSPLGEFTATLPADTCGFAGGPPRERAFDHRFVVRALPTIGDLDYGWQPDMLVCYGGDLAPDRQRDNAYWLNTLTQVVGAPGDHYDLYTIRDVSAGLASRATTAQILGYDELVFSSGTTTGVGFGDESGASDVDLLQNWIADQHKHLLVMGDHFAAAMDENTASRDFLATYLGGQLESRDLRPWIGGQYHPLVVPTPGSPLWIDHWRLFTRCVNRTSLCAVVPTAGAERIAEYTDINGQGGAYAFGAVIMQTLAGLDFRSVLMPSDITDILHCEYGAKDVEGREAVIAQRSRILAMLMTTVGMDIPFGLVAPVPAAETTLAVSCHPNPFNPAVEISWSLPRATQLEVEVYDMAGRRVRQLVHENAGEGPGSVIWRGDNDAGQPTAAGVYFCRVRADGRSVVRKIAMVK